MEDSVNFIEIALGLYKLGSTNYYKISDSQ